MAELITREKETVTLESSNLPLDEYVVLNTSHNLSFAGVLQGRLQLENEDGILVRLDEKTHFTIWCPIAHVKRLLVVPIQ